MQKYIKYVSKFIICKIEINDENILKNIFKNKEISYYLKNKEISYYLLFIILHKIVNMYKIKYLLYLENGTNLYFLVFIKLY